MMGRSDGAPLLILEVKTPPYEAVVTHNGAFQVLQISSVLR